MFDCFAEPAYTFLAAVAGIPYLVTDFAELVVPTIVETIKGGGNRHNNCMSGRGTKDIVAFIVSLSPSTNAVLA